MAPREFRNQQTVWMKTNEVEYQKHAFIHLPSSHDTLDYKRVCHFTARCYCPIFKYPPAKDNSDKQQWPLWASSRHVLFGFFALSPSLAAYQWPQMTSKHSSASSLSYLLQTMFLPHGRMHPWGSAAGMGSLAAHGHLTVLLHWISHQKESQVPYHLALPISPLLHGCNCRTIASRGAFHQSLDYSANSAVLT